MRLIAVLLTSLALLIGPALSQDDEVTLALGRTQSEAFLAGELDSIWSQMTPDMRSVFGTLEGLAAFHDQIASSIGTEAAVTDESTGPAGGGVTIYNRVATWTTAPGPVLMQWSFDSNGKIAGFLVQPQPVLAESRFLDYETRADLRLPFSGEWFVVWGGRTLEQNYHAADRAQRFAHDLVVMRDGASHSGNPQALESYYCWNQPILAPAPGIVVAAVSDLPDNAIGSTDRENPVGNHVVLDLGNSEYMVLAHMREGSLKVAAGAAVLPGEELGRCGNSGNTSEPHLHVHLQNAPDLATAEGLPTQFQNYRTGDTSVMRGEPLQGEAISSAE